MATTDASEEVGRSVPASPPRENLVRATSGITLTRADGATMPTLTGHFAVWDQWTEIRSAYEGNFMERFDPSSMTKTLSEHRPKVMFNHGKDPSIGEKLLGTPERIEPDATGAFYAVPLFETSYNRDLIPGLEAGEYGASFRFSVIREGVVQKPPRSEYNPRGIPERTVQEARVMEFGPVSFPAYAGATAGLRSMTDEYLFDALVEDPDRLRELCRRSGISLAGVNVPNSPAITFNITSGAGLLAVDDRSTDLEPEPSAATTPDNSEPDEARDLPGTEPEPPEATTHSNHSLFRFVDPPKHLKE